jgi:hypothetical protein
VLDESFNHLAPSAYTAEFLDENTLNIEFPNSASGYALIGKPDYVCSFPRPASASWFINHELFTDFNLITVWDAATNKTIVPKSIRHYKWTNYISLEFDNTYYGYVSLKSAQSSSEHLQRVHNLGEVLSPHVKIEIDLTNEPMEIDGIIYKNRLNKLIELWDKLRPISRVYHYAMVIAPELDFSGNRSSLYPYSSDIQFTTKFMGDPIYPISDSSVKMIVNPTNTVNVSHKLNTLNTIVQCFDTNNNMVEPDECYPMSINTTRLVFHDYFTGNIIISKADIAAYMNTYSTSGAPSASSYVWDVSSVYLLDKFDHIPQITDIDGNRVLADEINTQSPAEYPLVWFSPSSSLSAAGENWAVSAGYYNAVLGNAFDFYLPAGDVGTVDVMHNLDGESFQVAVFNNDNEMIYPKNIKIRSKDRLELTFDTGSLPIGGYAVVKKTSNIGYGTVYTFGYLKLGYGSTGKRYNPIPTNSLEFPYPETYTILDRDIEDDEDHYYITINIDENIDYSVNETVDKYGIRLDRYGIKEIGMYDKNGTILFYTYCSLIEKPLGVSLKLYYKIKKRI